MHAPTIEFKIVVFENVFTVKENVEIFKFQHASILCNFLKDQVRIFDIWTGEKSYKRKFTKAKECFKNSRA